MSKLLVPVCMILMICGRISEASISDVEKDCIKPKCPNGPYCFGFTKEGDSEFNECNLHPTREKCEFAFGAVRKVRDNKYKFQLVGKFLGISGNVGIGFVEDNSNAKAINKVDTQIKFEILCLFNDGKTAVIAVDPNELIPGGTVSNENKYIYCEFEIGDKPLNRNVNFKKDNYTIVLFGNEIDAGSLEPTYFVGGESVVTNDIFTVFESTIDGGVTSSYLPHLPGQTLLISGVSLSMIVAYYTYLKY